MIWKPFSWIKNVENAQGLETMWNVKSLLSEHSQVNETIIGSLGVRWVYEITPYSGEMSLKVKLSPDWKSAEAPITGTTDLNDLPS